MPGHVIALHDIERLRPTEAVSDDKVRSFASELRLLGLWTHPLAIEPSAQAVLDGNHRLAAAHRLGLKAVPTVVVDLASAGATLSAWRPSERLTPQDLVAAATSGRALPIRSVRLALDHALPRCSVPLQTLKSREAIGRMVATIPALPRRTDVLAAAYHALGRRIGIATLAARAIDTESAETLAPHPRLRQTLLADPAMAAILPGAPAHFSLGGIDHAPFQLRTSGLILLAMPLLEDAAALAVAARWALEAAHLREGGPVARRELAALLRHAVGLLRQTAPASRDLVLGCMPRAIAAGLAAGDVRAPAAALLEWQAGVIEAAIAPDVRGAGATADEELMDPVERILVAGGDSRLQLDPRSGQNHYGVPPRPRPEAVHFSSSTASAISEYGFLFCDLLRRDLLRAVFADGADPGELARRTADAVGREICELLGLAGDAADVAVIASGTDAELHAVMLSRAAGGGRRLTNILIAPSESGRGVALAGAGCYFDDRSSTGEPVRKGSPAWPEADIAVREVAIREDDGDPRPIADIDADVLAAGRLALAGGGQVLVHALIASKTGLSAPSAAAIDALVALAPERVDVVVDACQMRSALTELGALARRGWMLQVSGSKFLTGPPFSGALVVPKHFRDRIAAVGAALAAAPGVGHPDAWTAWWAERLPRAAGRASFGPLFRWLPALLEARLLGTLSEEFRRTAFGRFRRAIAERLAASPYIRPIDVGESAAAAGDDLARLSIQSFQVLGRQRDGSLAALDESACRRIFELLNRDVRALLPDLTRAQWVLAGQQCHVGQPVALAGKAVLRMVLGARFFSIVGFAGPGAIEAALESEISDALRAIAKLELLAAQWPQLAGDGT